MGAPYDGKHCPCPSDCHRRGNCAECCRFHHGRGEPTYCEFLYGQGEHGRQPERAIPTGREIRMLDYAPCAG